MEPWHAGHVWSPAPGLCPALVAVEEVRGRIEPGLSRITARHWTIDYEFRSYGRYRTASPRFPWQERRPRTMHLYPPGTTYWEDVRAQSGTRHSAWMIFTGGQRAGLEQWLHPRRRYARFLDTAGELGALFSRAAQVGQQSADAGFWDVQALLCEVLGLIARMARVDEQTCAIPAPNGPAPAPSLADAVEAFLRPRLDRALYVDDIARHLHMSPATLAHRLQREAGQTPMRMLARLRVAQAKAMLLRGRPLKEIAERVGFCDAFHLSKVFRRIEGVPPSALRRDV